MQLDFTFPSEEWREIPGSDGRYLASTLGRICTLYPRKDGRYNPKIINTWISKIGYEHCKLSRDGKSRTCLVHRMVMFAFVGPSDLDVNHIDGNKLNNCLSNLQYLSHQENIRHAVDVLGKKFGVRGQKSPLAKLSDVQVRWIRRLDKSGFTHGELVEIFGISNNHLSAIRNGRARVNDGQEA
jgi:hypothetical protein